VGKKENARDRFITIGQEARGKGINMSTIESDKAGKGNQETISQRTVILAAIAPMIFGLLGILAILVNNLVTTIVLWSISSLIITLGGFYAVVKRLPVWGLTWAGSALMIIALVFKLAAEELGESGRFIISQGGDIGLMALIILAGLVLLIMASKKGWKPAGLVSIAFTSILGIYTLLSLYNAPFYRMDRALLALPACILFALLIFLYMRSKGSTGIVFLALTWGINACIVYLSHITWQDWLSAQGRGTPLVPLLILFTGLIISGPIIAFIRIPTQKMLRGS
jgi:hypothetical protein